MLVPHQPGERDARADPFRSGRLRGAGVFVRREPDGTWLGNFRLPPGLRPGWNDVRLRFADSDFGQTLRIAVDMPVQPGKVVLVGACDRQHLHREYRGSG